MTSQWVRLMVELTWVTIGNYANQQIYSYQTWHGFQFNFKSTNHTYDQSWKRTTKCETSGTSEKDGIPRKFKIKLKMQINMKNQHASNNPHRQGLGVYVVGNNVLNVLYAILIFIFQPIQRALHFILFFFFICLICAFAFTNMNFLLLSRSIYVEHSI